MLDGFISVCVNCEMGSIRYEGPQRHLFLTITMNDKLGYDFLA